MKTEIAPELEAAFLAFKKSDQPNIFADCIADLCEAEIRRIHACSNGNSDAFTLSEALTKPTPNSIFTFDRENALEHFADGSLYEKSNAVSSVWAFASDFYIDRIAHAPDLPQGLRAFFGDLVDSFYLYQP